LNKVQNVQVSDTTDDDPRNQSRVKKYYNIKHTT
jgi:hypothetical protein